MSVPNVLVVDAGLGNIGSVVAALERQRCIYQSLKAPPSLDLSYSFSHLILPGVGSFSAGIEALHASGWFYWLKNTWHALNRPSLGICLGMQLLATEGNEGSKNGKYVTGLDFIPGRVSRLDLSSDYRLPHVGWNSINHNARNSSLFSNLPNAADFYFVHSFAFETVDPQHTISTTDYGLLFASAVSCRNFYGVQFHPEKSQKYGRLLISNFLSIS